MKVVVLTFVLALAMGCVAPAPVATPEPFLARQLDVKLDPKEAASYLLNPSPLGKGGYSKGTMVTIDILPQSGWQVEESIGPVFNIDGKTAKIEMDSSQAVAVRLKLTTPPTATPTDTPIPPTDTPIPPTATPIPPTDTPIPPTPTKTPTPIRTLVWPTIHTVDPESGLPGDRIEVKGNGGYYKINGGYDESSRSFALYLAGSKVGSISCNRNACLGPFNVPSSRSPDLYNVKTEGGSPIIFVVNTPPPTPTPTRRPTPTPNASYYFDKGYDYGRDGKYQLAINAYTTAIRLNPGDSGAYNNRGNAYSHLGQYQRAISDYGNAIQLDPIYALAWLNRGRAYVKLGQYQRAIQDTDKAIQLDPNDGAAYNSRAWTYYYLGQHGKKNADIAKACSLDSKYC